VAGARAFTQKPIMGYGTGGFKAAVRPYGIYQVAHNSFLSVLVEQGIVGLLLYLTMIFAVVLAVCRLPRLERRFALVLLCTLGVTMLPLTWEANKAVWFVLAALLGLARAQTVAPAGAVGEPLPERPPLGARVISRRGAAT